MILMLIPLMWSWSSQRNRLDCPSPSRVFPERAETWLRFWTNKRQCWKKVRLCRDLLLFEYVVSSDYDLHICALMSTVYCTSRMSVIPGESHSLVFPFISKAVVQLVSEVRDLKSCSCASWSSRAEWKCKLITLYSRPLWPMLNLETYTLLF